jgi:TRAP-type transport system periplasmic protein
MARLAICGFVSALCSVTSVAFAEFNWSAVLVTEDELSEQAIERFSRLIRNQTDGRLDVNVEKWSIGDFLQLTGEVRVLPSVMIAPDEPSFQVETIPFLVSSYTEAQQLWEAQRPFVEERLAERALQPLFSVQRSPIGVFTTRSVESLDDFVDLRIAAPTGSLGDLVRTTGATPVEIPNIDAVMAAHSVGTVDGWVMSAEFASQFAPQVRIDGLYYQLCAVFPSDIALVETEALNNLPGELREVVLSAASEVESWALERRIERDDEALELLVEHGFYASLEDVILQRLRERSTPIINRFIQMGGGEIEVILERASLPGDPSTPPPNGLPPIKNKCHR